MDFLRDAGMSVVVVAALEEGAETWAEDTPIVGADEYLINGELDFMGLWDLCATARLVVSPVGFAAPMGMFNSIPTVIIHGGAGGWNSPRMIDAPCDEPLIHVVPKNYCQCRSHNCRCCDKTIDEKDLEDALQRGLQR